MSYHAWALSKSSGVKIMAGVMGMGPDPSNAAVQGIFYFGSFFTAGCRPSVVATANPVGNGWRYTVTVRGPSGPGSVPDSVGFSAGVYGFGGPDPNRMYLNFIATGW